MAWFVQLMISPIGRAARLVAGMALVAWGIAGITGTAGLVVAAIGLVPLLAGLFDRCVFAPLFGFPFSGPSARARLSQSAKG